MATDSDLQTFKSKEVSDVGTNGGKLSDNVITSGVLNNVWPNVLKAERDAGGTKYRKLFEKFNTDDNAGLSSAFIGIDKPTDGDDWVIMFMGTPTDTQADIVGTERKYGCAYLKNNITAGAQTLVVTVEDASLTTGNDQIFQDGDTIRLTDKTTPDALTGNQEDLTINGAPTVSGNDVTITVTETIANDYLVADNARAYSMYPVSSDIKASADPVVVTSTSGTYDDSGSPVELNNQGAIDATFTFTFSDATNFSVTCDDPDVTGLPSGDINTDYTATNAYWSKKYLTILSAGWGGTWANGDTLEVTTKSATAHRWEKKVTPAGCSPLSNNKVTSVWTGESV